MHQIKKKRIVAVFVLFYKSLIESNNYAVNKLLTPGQRI